MATPCHTIESAVKKSHNFSILTVGIFSVSQPGVYHFSFGMQVGQAGGGQFEMVVKKHGTNNEVCQSSLFCVLCYFRPGLMTTVRTKNSLILMVYSCRNPKLVLPAVMGPGKK